MSETLYDSEKTDVIKKPAVEAAELTAIHARSPEMPAAEPDGATQAEVARALISGKPGRFDGGGHEAQTADPQLREAAINWLGDGRISYEDIRRVVTDAPTPWAAEEGAAAPYDGGKLIRVAGRLAENPAHRELLGVMAGHDGPEAAQLLDMIDESPDPIAFEAQAMDRLKVVALSEGARERLAADLPAFAHEVYGRQAEVLEQIALMRTEAQDRVAAERVRATQAAKADRVEAARAMVERHAQGPEAQSERPPRYRELEEDEARGIMAHAEVHGSPYRDRETGERRTLTAEDLAGQGLAPKFEVPLKGLNIYLSEPYKESDDSEARSAVVGYVHTPDGKIVARNFGESKSQGLMRLHQGRWPRGRIAKGYGESSLQPPFEVQAALAEIVQREPIKVKDPEFVFNGTATSQENVLEDPSNTYGGEVAPRPERLPGNFYGVDVLDLVEPEAAEFADWQAAPDYSQAPQLEWDQVSRVAGPQHVEVYPSADGRYRYAVAQSENGRVNFLAVEDTEAQVTRTGVLDKWVDGGALTLPPYEYPEQTDGFGDESDSKEGYVSMEQKYISHIPEIKRYKAVKAARLDESGGRHRG